jgi:4-hydroxy-tetrahydrodipicolinate synthase
VELIAAVPTPFTASGDLDLDGARRVFAHAASAGASLLVAGTTGEFPSLDDDERLDLFEVALNVAGPDRTIAHVGAADTRHATRLTAAALAAGATRLAVLSPYYLRARPDELTAHFSAVRQAAGGAPVYAYLFPERTGVDLPPADLSRVAARTGLAGIKLSGSSAALLKEYVVAAPTGFAVYTGDDSQVVEAARVAAAGVVSGVSSAFPAEFADLVAEVSQPGAEMTAAETPITETPETPETPVTDMAVQLLGPSIGRLKYALSLRGLAGPYARMTVDPPDAAARAAIGELMSR